MRSINALFRSSAGSGAKLRSSALRSSAVKCDKKLTRLFSTCIARRGLEVMKLPSGAGHDAAAISSLCPVAMLFVRCKAGISHNPAESVRSSDVACAICVLADFIQTLGKRLHL